MPTIPPAEHPQDKVFIPDMKVKSMSGALTNVEIRFRNQPALRKRILCYATRLVTEQLGEGDDYEKIRPGITIPIKVRREHFAQLIYAREEGETAGEMRGLEKGRLENSLGIARKLLARGINPEIVLDVTGLSRDDLKSLLHRFGHRYQIKCQEAEELPSAAVGAGISGRVVLPSHSVRRAANFSVS
jgi:hypothetical protein